MHRDQVLQIFKETGAFLQGHFILSSGLHSPVFLQKARVFMHPDKTEKLCRELAKKIRQEFGSHIDYLVGPAVGGIIPAYETGRHLEVPVIWVEREEGEFALRRFEIEPEARIVVVEDIVSTGLSIREAIDCMKKSGAKVLGAACIIDRSAGEANIGAPLVRLADYKVPAYKPDQLPEDLAAIPAIKPGSRGLK